MFSNFAKRCSIPTGNEITQDTITKNTFPKASKGEWETHKHKTELRELDIYDFLNFPPMEATFEPSHDKNQQNGNRLNEHPERSGLLPESQCGFRKNRGTIDMIFTARQLQEKCQEQNVDLYMTFVDLTKAFDTVSREGLWKIMAMFGCPAKFIAKVRQFHDGMLARVQNDGEFSYSLPVTNGVKQGCVLASTLHDVFSHAYRYFSGWWQWYTY